MRAPPLAVNFVRSGQIFVLGTMSIRFFSQDFFDRQQKIKFRFFLVDVENDF